ncbi:uncharacterized protein LOC141864132 isoform X2 [Acropora palmata]|uniref:uncharacterized protein LOC141864132 isoform X2 n=1 Tax=Acropora palmata TaxID=6131 RepID=UPI003DA02D8A
MFYHPAWLFRVGKKIECSSLRSFLPQNENYFDKTKLRGTSTRSVYFRSMANEFKGKWSCTS